MFIICKKCNKVISYSVEDESLFKFFKDDPKELIAAAVNPAYSICEKCQDHKRISYSDYNSCILAMAKPYREKPDCSNCVYNETGYSLTCKKIGHGCSSESKKLFKFSIHHFCKHIFSLYPGLYELCPEFFMNIIARRSVC